MTRGKPKVAATRHAKHEWSLKRKALAVTLSIALLGLGTPAVSFADSAADQQSKAVEAQETTSAVSAQEQAPASAEPAQQVVASAAALGGAAVDDDVAVDSEAGVDGVADNAVAPASSENASGAASKNELSAPASSDDQPSDKASTSTEAASKKGAASTSEARDDKANDQVNAASNEAATSAEYTVAVGESITIFGSGSLWESSWASEGTAATVTGDGNKATVTGVSAGDVTVTYTYKSVFFETRTETFVVHVVGARPKISIEGDLVVGGSLKLSVQNFENAGAIQWASDNTKVATIDSDGVVEGISVGKANITASAGSESATKQIEVKRNELNGGYYVYLYTKTEGDTTGLALTKNKDGWYTIGRVWVNGISAPTYDSTGYVTSGDNYDKVIAALGTPGNVDLYGVNSINLEDIEWSVSGQSTGLKTASGASDYDTSNKPTWHLDGYVNFDKVNFGSVVFHYVDALNHSITIAEDRKVTAKATEPGKTFDFSKYIIQIEGYSYYTANPLSVTIDKGTTKDVTLYYSKLPKRQIEMQAKSGTATYNGQEQSASGFESDVFEFDGVKYTVSGLTATAKGTDAGTYEGTVEGTAVVTDPEGNDVTAQFDVAAQPGELVITPAPYSVTTESATKVYDGTALTAGGKIEGLLEGETANLKVTGSQTKVGASENTYTIEWTGTAKESNYKLESESIGTLTVTAAPDSPTPDDQSKDQDVFNGANSGLVQTGDATGAYSMAAIIAAAVAAFVSLLAVRRRKE